MSDTEELNRAASDGEIVPSKTGKNFWSFGTRSDPEATAKYEQAASEVLSKIEQATSNQQLEDVQYELARLANLIPNLRNCEYSDRIGYVKLAVHALATSGPNIEFAKIVRQDLEFLIQRTQRGMFRFVYRISGTTPLSAVLSGLICSILAMAAFMTIIFLAKTIYGFDMKSIVPGGKSTLLMSVSAVAGSYLSVLSRLNQVSASRGYDPFLTFCTGFFKPIIGVLISLFLFCALESGVVKIAGLSTPTVVANLATGNMPDTKLYLYLTIAFISGFSERLVSDFMSRAETQAVGSPRPLPTTPSHGPKTVAG